MARTTHCQCVGRGFEPRLSLQYFILLLMFSESEKFPQEDYSEVQFLQDWGIKTLLALQEEMNSYLDIVLRNYKYGNRFMHAEAYELCSAGIFWPDFLYDPLRSNHVLNFGVLNSVDNLDLRERFEEWFDLNRVDIADCAAQALGKEIEPI